MKLLYLACTLQLSPLILAATLFSKANPALSQASNIVPDNTLGEESSQVIENQNVNGLPTEVITGGAQREQNLFHSFQEFNVSEGRGAIFANPNAIDNIFSRVTGSNPSNILGRLGVGGAANLYLINPNGIVFGENAALDVQGSFTATTAEGIEFSEGGLFSAVEPGESLLTISVPLGLQFGSSPGSIINLSKFPGNANDNVGLQVPTGENLTLVGGDILFDAGEATARGGNIYLGGLGAAGTVNFSDNGNLSFPDNIAKANIVFIDAANVDVSGTGGNITIDAQNLSLADLSFIKAGLTADSISPEAQAGDITINVAENIILDNSGIGNVIIVSEAVGNSGDIFINTGSLKIIDGSVIGTVLSGKGNIGVVEINATGDIVIDGEDSVGGIISQVDSDAEGDAGGVTISTNNLNLTNGGEVSASTFGQGNAGAIKITATGDILADGEDSEGSQSGITSLVNPGAEGDAGGVTISTNNLNLTNGGRVSASTFGLGNAGAIKITATGEILADGEDSDGLASGIISQVASGAEGDAGRVTISTTNLNLTNGGEVDATTLGKGNAGAIDITAKGDITADLASGIISGVASSAEGNAGGITISTTDLNLTNGSGVSASTAGKGNAGAIDLTATGKITADGEDSDGLASGIISQVASDAEGDAGGVTISTNNLSLTNGGGVSASTFGLGNAGAIGITAKGEITADGEDSDGLASGITSIVKLNGVGDSEGITISTNNLSLTNGGNVNASTFGQGNAGAIKITATGDILASGEDSDGVLSGITSLVSPDAEGNSEGITISTNNLNLTNGGFIDASTFGLGNAGAIKITATGEVTADGENSDGFGSGISSQVRTGAEGDAGGITISTNNLNLTNGGRVDASTLGQGNAGAIGITATGEVTADGENSDGFESGIISGVDTNAEGDAGGVTISTNNLSLTNGGGVSASTFGLGNAGEIRIYANSANLDRDSSITSISESSFSAGDIILNVPDYLQLTNSSISTSSTQSSGGNLTIFAGGIQLQGNSDITTDISSGIGSGGNITLTADSILAFDDSDIFASAPEGRGGNITFNTFAYFGENFTRNSLTADPDESDLDLNNRADVNATGAVSSGVVEIPDVSFIQNSLTELPNNSLDTDELVANSCVVPVGDRSQGKFIITGGESLPVRPGGNLPSKYPTGEVRGVSEDNASSWQPGDPIIEPQGAYRLANGKMVLSRECSQ
ncbi:filamentous hemagglutinin N-terminal domain-containing protein [Pleurocapsales cyanobacterium LEGE 10410]|nr:filamentous hemagglutinin N-terminal domain-containing protein [Pleurocapsales cyanobacterium LEGE 10410]